jgi:hypothetical protein
MPEIRVHTCIRINEQQRIKRVPFFTSFSGVMKFRSRPLQNGKRVTGSPFQHFGTGRVGSRVKNRDPVPTLLHSLHIGGLKLLFSEHFRSNSHFVKALKMTIILFITVNIYNVYIHILSKKISLTREIKVFVDTVFDNNMIIRVSLSQIINMSPSRRCQ